MLVQILKALNNPSYKLKLVGRNIWDIYPVFVMHLYFLRN
ncbi:hypothetical protein EMIT0180MI3_350040 [Priestia megaterium]